MSNKIVMNTHMKLQIVWLPFVSNNKKKRIKIMTFKNDTEYQVSDLPLTFVTQEKLKINYKFNLE